jgi:hypothetical protein
MAKRTTLTIGGTTYFEYHWDGGAGRCAAAECACTSFQA